jgi:hypothetical protein
MRAKSIAFNVSEASGSLEKKDCEIPIYNIGSMFTIKNEEYDNYYSNIT